MKVEFHKGFIVYRNGEGPVYVTPHSGPALVIPTSRDDNSDTVASLCWSKTGGTLIVSGLPRKMSLGIDLNRDYPKEEEAIGFWDSFIVDENKGNLMDYRKKYSWVARNKEDHEERLNIYNDFWNTVRSLQGNVVFVHRKYTRIKNFPSIIDFVTYEGRGLSKTVMKNAIDSINSKYKDFFSKISGHYKNMILLEEMRIVDRTNALFNGFSLEKMLVEYKENIKADIKVIEEHADPLVVERMKNDLNEETFIAALKSALRTNQLPMVTLEAIFRGKPAWKQKEPMFGKRNMIEIESNAFMNYWYPDETANIILDILKEAKIIS